MNPEQAAFPAQLFVQGLEREYAIAVLTHSASLHLTTPIAYSELTCLTVVRSRMRFLR